MSKPEGYRKALRLMKLAERFGLPLLTFIDTPGAYPGVDAEERGQSEAIARNLYVLAELDVPVVCTVIGEGGSGGALAIGVGDCVMLLEYSTYSVISPEGCASILWKDANKAAQAAEALGITAPRLLELGLIDEIVSEPLGGAHRDVKQTAETLREALSRNLDALLQVPSEELLERRYQRPHAVRTIQGLVHAVRPADPETFAAGAAERVPLLCGLQRRRRFPRTAARTGRPAHLFSKDYRGCSPRPPWLEPARRCVGKKMP